MAKRNKQEWVSESFAKYLTQVQIEVNKDSGKKFSRADVTSFIAATRPQIRIIERKKGKSSIFDF